MRGINYLKEKQPADVLAILNGVNPKKDVRYGIFGGRSFAVEGTKISLNVFLRYPQADKSIAARVLVLDAESLQAPDRHLVIRLLQPLWKILHAVRSFFSGSARERTKLLSAIEAKKENRTPPPADRLPAVGTPFPSDPLSSVSNRLLAVTSPTGGMSPSRLTRMPRSPVISSPSQRLQPDHESAGSSGVGTPFPAGTTSSGSTSPLAVTSPVDVMSPAPITSQAASSTSISIAPPEPELAVAVFEIKGVDDAKFYRKTVGDQMWLLPKGSIRYMLVEIEQRHVLYRFVRLADAYEASERDGHLFEAEGFDVQVLSEYIEGKWGQVVTNEDFIE